MKFLLDTQVFIMLVQRRALPDRVRAHVEDADNALFLSLVSPWEIQIKVGVNKLTIGQPVRQTIETETARGTFQLLPITLDHIDALSRLPSHHRDPFDRLLIAQAIHEGLTLVTGDHQIRQYPVQCLWE